MCDEPYVCVWGIELTSEPGGEDLWVCELGCDYGPDLVVCKSRQIYVWKLRVNVTSDSIVPLYGVLKEHPGTNVINLYFRLKQYQK